MSRVASPELRILIADGNGVSRSLLQMFLGRFGTCDLAAHGKEALQAYRAARDEGRPYHLLCLDIQMPEMDGLAVRKAVREAEKGSSDGPGASRVLITTAFDEESRVRRAISLGCDGYFVKPLRLDKVSARLREIGLLE